MIGYSSLLQDSRADLHHKHRWTKDQAGSNGLISLRRGAKKGVATSVLLPPVPSYSAKTAQREAIFGTVPVFAWAGSLRAAAFSRFIDKRIHHGVGNCKLFLALRDIAKYNMVWLISGYSDIDALSGN
jgi:hypothetical protein